ncbi:MAG: hypothetical protein EAZ97_06815 [Bacteroidetes bacterium]|nr:MAG: hypothetical protein EAZ97_06815 [Bacteroidota bacterium]
MKFTIKLLIFSIFLLIFLLVFLINYQLYDSPKVDNSKTGKLNEDVLFQLHFLKTQMQAGTAEQMQNIYPEGFFFSHVLYGLACTDLLKNADLTHFQYLTREIDWTLAQLESEKAKEIFPIYLPLEYGAFYVGWKNYLLGKKLSSTNKPDSLDIQKFQKNCEKIYEAYHKTDTLFLESYTGAIWQADNVVCMANLAMADRLFGTKYQGFIKFWVEKMKKHLDPKTNLIPHSAFLESGKMNEGARGSSQSLMLNFLPEIDSVFAKSQFLQFKKLFLDYRLGLPAVREYPKNSQGEGDIDSGLIIFDMGSAASIVGIRAFAQNGDSDMAWQIRNCVEAFGFPLIYEEKKSYLFGILPIADVFIAWANAHETFVKQEKPIFWQMIFHFLSFLVIFPINF